MHRAEEEGVECYVVAQDSSKPIFVKYGWTEGRELVIKGLKRATVLVWTPRTADGVHNRRLVEERVVMSV